MYEDKIFEIIDKYEGKGCWREVSKDGEKEEICVVDELDSIFEDGIQHKVNIDNMFDSCDYSIDAISVAWIENGKLESILAYVEYK